MTSEDIQLVIDGENVKGGNIDAGALANTLKGYSDAFRRANFLVNGEQSEASIRVEANFQSGSFDVNLHLVQHIVEGAKTLLGDLDIKGAAELALLLGLVWHKDSVISLYKFLKGQKPDEIAPTDANNVDVIVGGQKKTVSKVVVNLYGDSAIKTALAQSVEPLRTPGIERIEIKKKGNEPTLINKNEAQ